MSRRRYVQGWRAGTHLSIYAMRQVRAGMWYLCWLRLWRAPAWWLWGLARALLLTGGRNRATVAP